MGRKYNRQKKSQGGDRGNQYVAKDQNDTLPTADKLAAEADELMAGIRAAQPVGGRPRMGEEKPTQLVVEVDRSERETAHKVAEVFNTNRRSKGSTVNPHRQAAQPARQELHTPSR